MPKQGTLRYILAHDLALSTPPTVALSPVWHYLARLGTDRSRRTMRQDLSVVARRLTRGVVRDPHLLNWARVRHTDLLALRAQLVGRYSAAYANTLLVAAKQVLACACDLGLLDATELHHCRRIPRVRGAPPPAGRCLSREEIGAMIHQARADRMATRGRRNLALLAMVFGGAMRAAEALSITLRDWHPDGRIVLRLGKGRRGRVVFLAPEWAASVEAWVALRGRHAGPLLCALDPAGRVQPHGIERTALNKLFTSWVRRAGIPPATPHDCRRTAATFLKAAGTDLDDIREFLGHAHLSTTVRHYFRNDKDAAKQRAAATLTMGREGS